MTTSIKDYNYKLPKNLIADKPRSKREQAKLMIFDNNREHIEHTSFSYLAEHINEGDLLIFPGYLPHKVAKNESNEDRIVISFNVDIR